MFKFGTILKPVGLRGEVRVFSDSDFLKERLIKGQIFKTEKGDLTIQTATLGSNVHKVKFKELSSIEDAEKYRQMDLMLETLDSSLLDEDEYYFVDLIGCDVYFDDQCIGQVLEVMDMSAHPVLRIKTESETFLIPFIKAFVPEIDVKNKRIKVNLIEGMR